MTKIDKRELKRPDEFMTLGTRAAQYVAENATLVIGGTLLVLALIAAGFGWIHQQRLREVEAAGKLYEGERLLAGDPKTRIFIGMPAETSAEEKKKAVVAFDRVAAEYAGTAAARRARLMAGDVHLELGENDPAITAYEQSLRGARPEEEVYARIGLGRAYEAKQAWEDAAAQYRKITGEPSLPLRDIATIDLARALARGGKTGEARELLAGFAAEFPDSSLKATAERELEELGGEASEEGSGGSSGSSASPRAPSDAALSAAPVIDE